MEVQYREETDHDAWERQCMEDSVQKFHVNTSEAAADAVEQHRWN